AVDGDLAAVAARQSEAVQQGPYDVEQPPVPGISGRIGLGAVFFPTRDLLRGRGIVRSGARRDIVVAEAAAVRLVDGERRHEQASGLRRIGRFVADVVILAARLARLHAAGPGPAHILVELEAARAGSEF